MGVVAPPQAPPFPFTVEQFLAEVSPPSAAATASQACAAFAQLATKVVVPETFRAAVPAVLGLVAREGDGLLEAKESALASLVALLACVPGAAEDAAAHGAVASVLAACEAARERPIGRQRPGGVPDTVHRGRRGDGDGVGRRGDRASDRVRQGPRGRREPAVARSRRRGRGRARRVARWTCCAGSRRSGGTAARVATLAVRRGGVAALGRALVAARNDEVAVRALIGLAMTTAHEAQREELVAVPGACAALTRATRSPDADVAGAAKALLRALGRDEALRPAVAAALRETQASGTAADLDSA